MSDTVELLTTDDEGHAVEGMKVPLDHQVLKYLPEGADVSDMRLAYLHKFFRRDKRGRPIPGTLVKFFVPDHLLDGAWPSLRALRLVEERMGWTGGRYRDVPPQEPTDR